MIFVSFCETIRIIKENHSHGSWRKIGARLSLLLGSLFALSQLVSAQAPETAAEPIRLHPDNPHYFLFRGRPAVLISSGEHYGAVLNPDFDYLTYLNTLQAKGFNLTRIMNGTSREDPNSIFWAGEQNTLAPRPGRYLAPWARIATPGYRGGGNKFDLDKWDEAYFQRLENFVREAGKRGIVVELSFFSADSQWAVTHVFAQQFPILDDQGKVSQFLFKARERGIFFDLGHGAGSFWWRNAVPAIKQGFVPDSISTDLHMGNVNGPVVDFITTASKLLVMEVPLEDVIRRATVNPARQIRRPELGTLSVGREADIAVIELRKGRFGYTDCGRAKLIGDRKLENRLTFYFRMCCRALGSP